jgi:hypothetical protein
MLARCAFLFFFSCAAVAAACSSSSDVPESSSPEAGVEDGGGTADVSTTPDSGSFAACEPTAVPADVRTKLGLSAFYTQYVDLRGFPIVASSKTTPKALCVARDVVEKMLEFKPVVIDRLIEKKIRLAIMAKTEVTTDIPEHSDLTPKDYWDQRARGLGATLARPAVSAAEENILCLADDRYRGESILVHEFSHAIFNIGIELFEPGARSRLDSAYAASKDAGLFADTYAGSNADEYWAEGVQDWFDTNIQKSPTDGVHNQINTRSELETYDPTLAALIAESFGKLAWRYSCP